MYNIDIRNITPLTDFRNNIKKYLEEISIHKKPIILTQHGNHGIQQHYLWDEYIKAFAEKPTMACETKVCRRCGVCSEK